MQVNNLSSIRLVRTPEVCAAIGHSAEWIRFAVLAGVFPKPVRIGKRSIAWQAKTIEDFIQSRQQVSN